MRAGMLSYRMNSSSGAGNRRNYAYILNTTRDFSSHNPEQFNSEFYLRFLTLEPEILEYCSQNPPSTLHCLQLPSDPISHTQPTPTSTQKPQSPPFTPQRLHPL